MDDPLANDNDNTDATAGEAFLMAVFLHLPKQSFVTVSSFLKFVFFLVFFGVLTSWRFFLSHSTNNSAIFISIYYVIDIIFYIRMSSFLGVFL